VTTRTRPMHLDCLKMKRSEVDRYNAHVAEQPEPENYVEQVTEWKHREYFESL